MNQIDHVMIRNRYRSTIVDVRSYRGADFDTDHYMVLAKCRLKLKSQTRLRREKHSKLNLESLKGDEARRKYQEAINKNLDVKSGHDSRTWESIKDVLQRAAEQIVEQIKNARNRWYNEECHATVNECSSARLKYMASGTQEMKGIYETQRKICKRIIQREKRKYLNRILENAENDHSLRRTRHFFRIIKQYRKFNPK